MNWWIWEQGEFGEESWDGPYDDSEKAKRRAQSLGRANNTAESRIYRLVFGNAGETGRCSEEFYAGEWYRFNGSGWDGFELDPAVQIPAQPG